MWITSRSHYGLITMSELARSYGQGPVSLSYIAEKQQMPMAYLEQLVSPLKKAGLLKATRGQRGGFELRMPPDEINMKQVISALDGDYSPVECVADRYEHGSCVREDECTSRFVWQKLKTSMDQVLESLTLADLSREPEGVLQKVGAVVDILSK